MDWKEIEDYSATRRFQWHFNPPSAAWWGGWWERLIRTMRDILKRMFGNKKLNLIQLVSVLCEVESEMNRRPLTYISEDLHDLIPLTPEMFLMDLPSSRFPETMEMDGDDLRRAAISLRRLRQELRLRFRKEYLDELVHRGKDKKTVPVSVGDVVLVGNDQKTRMFWPMGRVLELLPGIDSNVRVAKVRVKEGVITRPLQRLYPLEVSSKSEIPPLQPEIIKIAKRVSETPKNEDVVTRYGRLVKKPERLLSAI